MSAIAEHLCCVRVSFFSTVARAWVGRTSPKLPILCRVGRKTSVNQSRGQGDHSPEKPEKVRELQSGQGKVREHHNQFLQACESKHTE